MEQHLLQGKQTLLSVIRERYENRGLKFRSLLGLSMHLLTRRLSLKWDFVVTNGNTGLYSAFGKSLCTVLYQTFICVEQQNLQCIVTAHARLMN